MTKDSSVRSGGVGGSAFNTDISAYHYRRWQRQVETIKRKSEQIMSDMMDVLGEDDHFTDLADDVTCVAENLSDALDRAVAKRKADRSAALHKGNPNVQG